MHVFFRAITKGLCKIWSFHGVDYEKCLLGYKTPVCTSQETHYFSTTESSQLMLCKIWGFHGSNYEKWHLLGYKTPVLTSQGTHYFSTTESSQLMLCKIWGFHGSDYEEWRLLGYKTPVPTLQKTHCVSDTELSQLILCKIWGSHGGDYEEFHLLGCYSVSDDVSERRISFMIRVMGLRGGHILTIATRRNVPEDGILQGDMNWVAVTNNRSKLRK
jgi:hypothetical protein